MSRAVTHVFGIPGAKVDRLFDALVDSPIKTVVTRHEQNAAFIAGGIGRLTGRPGVCIATSGPGASNFVTGLATTNSEGDPVLAISEFGPIDFAAYAQACGAKGVAVDSPTSLAGALRRAMEVEGPVVISVPVDYAHNHLLMKPLEMLGETSAAA
jgi:thiamine pyrophosphate-dependent acetolactate synthase large subunit-like protein